MEQREEDILLYPHMSKYLLTKSNHVYEKLLYPHTGKYLYLTMGLLNPRSLICYTHIQVIIYFQTVPQLFGTVSCYTHIRELSIIMNMNRGAYILLCSHTSKYLLDIPCNKPCILLYPHMGKIYLASV